MNAPVLSRANATIGIVTALPVELAAVRAVMDCQQEDSVGGRKYYLGSLPLTDPIQVHILVVCCLPDMGTGSSAAATTSLIADCPSICVVVMCGIAGAVPNPGKPSDHVRLGDIVVSDADGVYQYDHESVREWGVELRPRPYSPSRTMLNASRHLAANEEVGERPWEAYLTHALARIEEKDPQGVLRWRRPPPQTDQLREFSSRRPIDYLRCVLRRVGIRASWTRYPPIAHPLGRSEDRPMVHHGAIACASRLQRNPRNRDFLRRRFRAKAFEMEGGGLAEAASQSSLSFFIVRGAQDYCNEEKTDRWRNYAALAAAAYTRALLEATPLFLNPRSRGATTMHLRSEVGVVVEADRIGDPAMDSAPAHLGTPASADASFRRLLADEAVRKEHEIAEYLDAWEHGKAFSAAEGASEWLAQHESLLPNGLVRGLYARLAQVETVRVRQARAQGSDADIARAQHYLWKAKNAPG